MFTGIIQSVSTVLSATEDDKQLRLRVKLPLRWRLSLGTSISIDGVCSTVTKLGREYFEVEYMPETLSKTAASALKKGARVNLEQSLRYGDPVDGHFVQGHVDARAKVLSVTKEGNSRKISFSLPADLMRYVAPRGSVAINGVALTVAAKAKASFVVALIPYTLAHTNLGSLREGSVANIETDMLARYGLPKARGTVLAHAARGTRKKGRA